MKRVIIAFLVCVSFSSVSAFAGDGAGGHGGSGRNTQIVDGRGQGGNGRFSPTINSNVGRGGSDQVFGPGGNGQGGNGRSLIISGGDGIGPRGTKQV